MIGIVKFYNEEKGFGFIAPEDGGKDIFFHVSTLKRANLEIVSDGQTLSFDVEEGRDGRPAATNIAVV